MTLDAEVRRFIVAHIDDVESLELLLLLHRKRREWTTDEAADELGLDADLVGDRLVHLCSLRLLASETGDRFTWSGKGELASTVGKLADAYRTNRRQVLDEISPAGPLASFSEAFRLRRRKDDDG